MRLIAELASDDVRREAAVARLRLAGPRALPRLRTFLASGAPAPARAAALAALDGIDDPRAIEPALSALDEGEPAVVVAALAVLRGWVAREDRARVLDAVARVALDPSRDGRVRQAALDALSDLPRALVQPLLDRAPHLDLRTGAEDPAKLRAWLSAEGGTSSLSALHDLIVRARAREHTEPVASIRHEWHALRGAVHARLAARGSRVALYDLRESFEAAVSPLPVDFLVAVGGVGDASCLEPMARAWERSVDETWWRERLSETAAQIVRRTRLSGRSAVMKRIRAKWAGFLSQVPVSYPR